jgi:hypothetical protein
MNPEPSEQLVVEQVEAVVRLRADVSLPDYHPVGLPLFFGSRLGSDGVHDALVVVVAAPIVRSVAVVIVAWARRIGGVRRVSGVTACQQYCYAQHE